MRNIFKELDRQINELKDERIKKAIENDCEECLELALRDWSWWQITCDFHWDWWILENWNA